MSLASLLRSMRWSAAPPITGLFAAVLVLGTLLCDARAHAASPSAVRRYAVLGDLGLDGGGGLGEAQGPPTRLAFDAFGRHFELEIEPHERLLSSTSVVRIGDGRSVVRAPTVAVYRGGLRGEPAAWVRLSVTSEGIEGVVWTPSETYVLQPLQEIVPDAAPGTAVYRQSDLDPSALSGRCGMDGEPLAEALTGGAVPDGNTADGGAGLAAVLEGEVALVADYEYMLRNGANSEAKLLSVLNLVDGVYEAEVGISLRAASVVLFTTGADPFTATADASLLHDEISGFLSTDRYCAGRPVYYCMGNPTLSCVTDADCGADGPCRTNVCTGDASCGSLGPCVANPIHGSDVAHLFTGRNLSGSTVGIAWIGGLCSPYYAASLSQDFTNDTYLLTLLVAHEIGHTFAAPHDNQADSPCEHEPFGKIMNPVLSSALADEFSVCSKSRIAQRVASVSCLAAPIDVTPAPTPTRTPTPMVVPPTLTRTATSTRTRTVTPTRTFTVAPPARLLRRRTPRIGVFRPASASWLLDQGDRVWTDCLTDQCHVFGLPNDWPIVGDWHRRGYDAIGVFRPSSGAWILDDGDRHPDGCVVDRCLGPFGTTGDIPVAGDWAAAGTARIGVFRGAGLWMLDTGNGRFDGCDVDNCVTFGASGDIPVSGRWHRRSGRAEIGVYRPSAGLWVLDDGNRVWDGCAIDRCALFGGTADQPVVGDWNGDGRTDIGVFRPSTGEWFLDTGNIHWDGCAIDICLDGFGVPGDRGIAGAW